MRSDRQSFTDRIEAYNERLELLSKRERDVIELAAEGRTDEQIAQTLGLSVSTINSYWVRVRGKLGQLSRVEIVTDILRHRARAQHETLRAENQRLQSELCQKVEEFEEFRIVHSTLREDAWHLLALFHSPDAILVTGPPANVVFANRAARKLFRAEPCELEGLPMRELTTSATPEAFREPCRELFTEGGPERETVGIAEPYFARRRDGSNFRAVLHAERFAAGSGPMAAVTIRDYLGEAESILQALRRPLGID